MKKILSQKRKIKIGEITHGLCDHKLYKTFHSMKHRCENPKSNSYYKYGARGIKVCKKWTNNFLSFYSWALHNGYDDNLTLDRIDVNGNYCPSNCRWVNRHIQAVNQALSKRNTTGVKGVTLYYTKDRYRARISINGKQISLGLAKTIEEAALLRMNYIKTNNLKEYKKHHQK